MKTENEMKTMGGNPCGKPVETDTGRNQHESDDSSFSIGDAIVLIAVMFLAGYGLWAGGSYVAEVVVPEYILPVVSDDTSHTKRISPDIEFRSYTYRPEGYIARTGSGDKLLDDVDWVHVGADRDSLAVFCREGKRGYINRFTGEVAIPAVYTRGWVFSEGLAAVVLDNRLKFIDRTGKVVIDNGLSVGTEVEDFVFHDGHCKVYDAVSGKTGLVGRDGQWRLPAAWDWLQNDGKVWICGADDAYGLYHHDHGQVLEPVYHSIRVDGGEVLVHGADNIVSRYDLTGNLRSELVIFEVGHLPYPTGQLDTSDGVDGISYTKGVADCRVYKVETDTDGTYCGLMDRRGNCVTKPLYRQIDAIARDRYLTWPQGVILDNNGSVVDCYDLPGGSDGH